MESIPHLSFPPVDPVRDAELCATFCTDAFVCSLGSADRFDPERYRRELPEKLARFSGSFVLVYLGETVIGMVELSRWKHDASVGYVNQFYLMPEYRGQGLGAQLERYAEGIFRRLGIRTLRLSVSPINQRAMAFYRRHGWRDLGVRPDRPEVHYFEKTFAHP